MTSYDEETALIVVDVQNDFADPEGSLYVKGAEDILEFVNEQVELATEAGAFIVYTQDWHPSSTPHFDTDGGPWPVHCVAGTDGAAFHPDLEVRGEIVRKGTGGEDGYSGFMVADPTTGDEHATRLEAVLREQGITDVVIVGLATDYCVKATAIDAAELGFETTVLSDGIRAVDVEPGDGDAALDAMREAGATIE